MENNIEYFYLVKYPDGVFKIGRTCDPTGRIKQCGLYYGHTGHSGARRPVKVIASAVAGRFAWDIERMIGTRSEFNPRGATEFFKALPDELVDYLTGVETMTSDHMAGIREILGRCASDIIPYAEIPQRSGNVISRQPRRHHRIHPP